MSKIKTAIVINDLHIPFHDRIVLNLVEDFITEFKPDTLFLNGDIADFYEASTFLKMEPATIKFRDEIDTVKEEIRFLATLSKEVIYIEGNHEFRLKKYIAKEAQGLVGLECLNIENLLELPKNVKYIHSKGKEAYYRYGDVLIGHFNKVSKHSAYTAKALLESKGMSLIQGHTHRMGTHHKKVMEKELIAIENGCLCSMNPEYVNDPNWQHGFSVIYSCGDWQQIDSILIKDNQFIYKGQLFK